MSNPSPTPTTRQTTSSLGKVQSCKWKEALERECHPTPHSHGRSGKAWGHSLSSPLLLHGGMEDLAAGEWRGVTPSAAATVGPASHPLPRSYELRPGSGRRLRLPPQCPRPGILAPDCDCLSQELFPQRLWCAHDPVLDSRGPAFSGHSDRSTGLQPGLLLRRGC